MHVTGKTQHTDGTRFSTKRARECAITRIITVTVANTERVPVCFRNWTILSSRVLNGSVHLHVITRPNTRPCI